jgi:Metallo-beta-lactamase superfamily
VKKLVGTNLTDPPGSDEVEVSVFGPGYGECIVVHLTGAEWLVVDSCLSTETKQPVALDYFESIGVDAANAVRFVVSTHWHDDHVRGIGEVFEKCKSAKFVCAHGLQTSQFTVLLGMYSKFVPASGSGVDELLKVLSVLKDRKKINSAVSPRFVSEGTVLYQRESGARVLVKALSPSSPAFLASVARFGTELSPEGRSRSAIPCLEPNDLAIVLTVTVEEIRLLLGADLEENGRAGLGWQAVIDEFAHTDNSHQGFKIPHHGSVNGHHDPVWSQLLQPQPWAVLTPYLRGKKYLPQNTDIERISSLSPHSYSTASRSTTNFRHPDTTVQRQLREMSVNLIKENSTQGQVRLRKALNKGSNDWTVEFFGDARELSTQL